MTEGDVAAVAHDAIAIHRGTLRERSTPLDGHLASIAQHAVTKYDEFVALGLPGDVARNLAVNECREHWQVSKSGELFPPSECEAEGCTNLTWSVLINPAGQTLRVCRQDCVFDLIEYRPDITVTWLTGAPNDLDILPSARIGEGLPSS